jgi:hypothetical protein
MERGIYSPGRLRAPFPKRRSRNRDQQLPMSVLVDGPKGAGSNSQITAPR